MYLTPIASKNDRTYAVKGVNCPEDSTVLECAELAYQTAFRGNLRDFYGALLPNQPRAPGTVWYYAETNWYVLAAALVRATGLLSWPVSYTHLTLPTKA